MLTASLLAAACLAHLGVAEVAAPPVERLSSAQLREVNRLVSRFRAARKDRPKQVEIVREATKVGRPAVVALLSIITKEMYPELERYRSKFSQQAALASKQRTSNVDLEEVARLRATVLGLQQMPGFTKEVIVEKADPALKRLGEIFLVSRPDVLGRSKDLQADRDKLLRGVGMVWQACAVYLHEQMPADENKPKDPPDFERYLQGEEDLAVGLAAPLDPRTRQTLAANSQLAAQLDPEEARAILSLNLMRNLLGLSALAIDLKLCAAARDHSKDMHQQKFFSHTSPVPGKATPWDRAKRFGTSASAENIFMGVEDGTAANLGWFHSPGHHKNMLADHARVGMGRDDVCFTELFGS